MEADEIYASVANIKNSIVDLSSEDFDVKWNKRGVAGGISMDSDPKVVKGLAIFYGKLPGKKEKFRSDYKEFIIQGLPKEQAVAGAKPIEKSEVGEMVIKTIPQGNANTSTEKDKKAKQILNDNLNALYTKKGNVFRSGDQRIKVGKDGKLYKVDKYENRISNTPQTLAEARAHLGLPINGILTVNK